MKFHQLSWELGAPGYALESISSVFMHVLHVLCDRGQAKSYFSRSFSPGSVGSIDIPMGLLRNVESCALPQTY